MTRPSADVAEETERVRALQPLDHLEAEGFRVERVERSKWGIVERVAARKPARI